MRFGMTGAQVGYHMAEVRRGAARHRHRSPARRRCGGRPVNRRRSWLRSRIGFTLVEAGLRLLADGAQPRG